MRPRDRVMSHLRVVGEIRDPSGLASTVLADAVGYPGSSVAFAQLLSAMERSGLVEREVRGRRTYRIRLAPAAAAPASAAPASAAPASAVPASAAPASAVPASAVPAGFAYDELARRLLTEMVRRLTAEPAGGPAPRVLPPPPGCEPGAAPGARGDLARAVASLERKLATVQSRQRKLQAENTRLRELLSGARQQAADQSLAEQQVVAGAGDSGARPGQLDAGTVQLDAGTVQLLERLLSSLRGETGRGAAGRGETGRGETGAVRWAGVRGPAGRARRPARRASGLSRPADQANSQSS